MDYFVDFVEWNNNPLCSVYPFFFLVKYVLYYMNIFTKKIVQQGRVYTVNIISSSVEQPTDMISKYVLGSKS